MEGWTQLNYKVRRSYLHIQKERKFTMTVPILSTQVNNVTSLARNKNKKVGKSMQTIIFLAELARLGNGERGG